MSKMARRSSTTGYVGVYHGGVGKFVASLQGAKWRVHVGCFATAEEAARARDQAIVSLGLDWALAFPDARPEPGLMPEKWLAAMSGPAEDDDPAAVEARFRRMVARGDEIYGARLRAEAERMKAEGDFTAPTRQLMADVVVGVAKAVEKDIVRPIGDAVTALLITATAAAKAENARLDAAIAAEVERQRGDKPLH